jgi:Zn finger protein HypA/HybF involved in hydrogenase expression
MSEMKAICKNPWCKGTFFYKEEDMTVIVEGKKHNFDKTPPVEKKIAPSVCPKCKSFDTELSGGVEWKTKEYEGSRFDGIPHQVRYKVTNYK